MNKVIICEELSFFASSQSLLIYDFKKSLSEETIGLLNNCFSNVTVIYEKDNIDYFDLYNHNILLTLIDDLNDECFEILKESKISKKELSIVVALNNYSKNIQRLFEINIDSLILADYTDDEILLKLLLSSENNFMKDKYNELHQDMYLYNLKKDLQSASKDIKTIETQKAIHDETNPQDNEKLHDFIDNFNHDHVIDDSMWTHISEEVTSLNELYEENINKIVLSGFDEHIKYELTEIFSRYNSSLLLIPGLEEFAEIFNDISLSLTTLNLDKLDNQSMEVFDMFEYLYDDISKFFEIVMVERQTKNLNYLTDSMKSSVLQLKIKLGLVEFEEEELELF